MNDEAEFSDKTFGADRSYIPVLYHLKKEVKELIESATQFDLAKHNDAEIATCLEFADVFLLLIDAARKFDLDAFHLITWSRMKLEINKTRKWGQPDENGVVEHIRE